MDKLFQRARNIQIFEDVLNGGEIKDVAVKYGVERPRIGVIIKSVRHRMRAELNVLVVFPSLKEGAWPINLNEYRAEKELLLLLLQKYKNLTV